MLAAGRGLGLTSNTTKSSRPLELVRLVDEWHPNETRQRRQLLLAKHPSADEEGRAAVLSEKHGRRRPRRNKAYRQPNVRQVVTEEAAAPERLKTSDTLVIRPEVPADQAIEKQQQDGAKREQHQAARWTICKIENPGYGCGEGDTSDDRCQRDRHPAHWADHEPAAEGI